MEQRRKFPQIRTGSMALALYFSSRVPVLEIILRSVGFSAISPKLSPENKPDKQISEHWYMPEKMSGISAKQKITTRALKNIAFRKQL